MGADDDKNKTDTIYYDLLQGTSLKRPKGVFICKR